jgi:diaminohydroxyphosphoribosylaminopyrimidine deaminase/5-amino-6-(5-phosphoribosylamino)uracil reductase
MREKGIEVITQVLQKQCRKINEPFFHAITTGRPLVVVKVACSLDGKIATRTGHSQWISGPKALKYAHRLRARYDAICVGLGTVLADDPQLTYRGARKVGHPLRVVLDSRCNTPLGSKIVSGKLPGETLIATTKKSGKRKREALEKIPGVSVVVLPTHKGRVDLSALVQYLGKIGMNSLLIEGGGNVLASALEQDVVDQMRMVIAPMIIGGKDAVPVIGGRGFATIDEAMRLEKITVGRLGQDLLVRGLVKKQPIPICEA